MRLFFALWPEESLRRSLVAIIENLQPSHSGRWVNPAKLHMTLAFLGDIEPDRLEQLKCIGDSINQPVGSFILERLELWRSGVLSLVPSVQPEGLIALAQSLSERLREGGFRLEKRPFLPHLTLARRARRRSAARPEDYRPLVWAPRAFCLVESRMDELPSHYEILRSWPLPKSSRSPGPTV
ncbi:MAG: putative 2-5 ligase [Proteobacteria bacterium]|nr:putative 2-5 ligase [Pseudomonadota bacterium]